MFHTFSKGKKNLNQILNDLTIYKCHYVLYIGTLNEGSQKYSISYKFLIPLTSLLAPHRSKCSFKPCSGLNIHTYTLTEHSRLLVWLHVQSEAW